MRRNSALPPGIFLPGALLLFVLNMAPAPAKQQPKNAPITELTLERSVCFGSCPVYKATFHSDGNLVYVGRAYVDHKGTYVYSGDKHTKRLFRHLAELADIARFDQLNPTYLEAVSDVPHTTATVKRAGKRQSVESCCDKEPASLRKFETAFDNALKETWQYAKWKQTGKAEP